MSIAMLSIGSAFADVNAGAYLAARQAENNHDFSAAAKYLRQAVSRDPTNTTLLQREILALVGEGRVEDAAPIARRLKTLESGNQVANIILLAEAVKKRGFDAAMAQLDDDGNIGPLVDGLVRAWVKVGQGHMKDALAQFDSVSKKQGLAGFAAYHKAMALVTAGDLEAAEKTLSRTEISPTRRGIIAHVEVLSQLERNDDAIALLDAVFGAELDAGLAHIRDQLEAGKKLPITVVRDAYDGVSEVFYGVAAALTQDNNDAFALAYVRVAEYLRPDDEDAILLSAQLLENLGRYELAEKAFARIDPDSPSYQSAVLGRAEALRMAGRADEGIALLEELARTYPDQTAVHEALGDALRRQERYEEAAKAYDRAIALFTADAPEHWATYYTAGIANERIKNWKKAEKYFRKALELQPDQPLVLNYLGYSYVEMGEHLDEALQMIKTAVKKRPRDGYITDSLGWAYFKLGRYEDAVKPMERAVELLPTDTIVNDHLGDVYWAVGRKREARFQWSRALSFYVPGETTDADPDRIRRKLEVGLDAVLEEEGAPPLSKAHDG